MKVQTSDYRMMLEAYRMAEGEPAVFSDSRIAHLVVHKNRVIGSHLIPGLLIEVNQTTDGVDLALKVLPGERIEYPVHLCFGILPKVGRQFINIDAEVGDDAGIDLLAHCIFPNAVKVQHQMQARIAVGKNAHYGYNEVHFHGEEGGTNVIPRATITLAEGARLKTSFQLIKGRVGNLNIDYEVEAGAGAVAEMLARVFGYGSDRIRIREKCVLAGERSRGLVKSRVAVSGEAASEVISEMAARGKLARGHVDCVEIVQDRAQARAIPIVDVFENSAKVTHEAAIGSVDKKQLETLMARGLCQEDAVEVIIKGMLEA